MEYCLNGFGLVLVIFALRAFYQIIGSLITGKPLDEKIEDFITGPTIIIASGMGTYAFAYLIYSRCKTLVLEP